MYKNLIVSLLLLLPHPSAIFDGTEIAARRIWFDNPNNSSFGNLVVNS